MGLVALNACETPEQIGDYWDILQRLHETPDQEAEAVASAIERCGMLALIAPPGDWSGDWRGDAPRRCA